MVSERCVIAGVCAKSKKVSERHFLRHLSPVLSINAVERILCRSCTYERHLPLHIVPGTCQCLLSIPWQLLHRLPGWRRIWHRPCLQQVCALHTPALIRDFTDIFASRVSALYNTNAKASDYYDISINSTEISQLTGLPFGFFPYPLDGYKDGYPVLFDSHINRERALQLLTYLNDGDYLDPKLTQSMSMQVTRIVWTGGCLIKRVMPMAICLS